MHIDMLMVRYALLVLFVVCIALTIVQRDTAWLFVIAIVGGAVRLYALMRGKELL